MERKEWLKWRHKGIGSSDAAAVMGVSKWKTAIKLFEEKILDAPPDEKGGFILDQGNRWEPRIRELIELEELELFTPSLHQHAEYPFLLCSTDGRSSSGKKICEIKIIGKEEWDKGVVPDHYMPQVQHQLLFGFEECLFAMHLYEKEMKEVDANKLKIIRVKPDPEYQKTLLAAEIKFWNEHVLKQVPPEPQSKDFVKLKDKGLAKLAADLKKWETAANALSTKIDSAKKNIKKAVEEAGLDRAQIGAVKVSKSFRKGNVDYKKIPAIAGMTNEEFEQYRGPGAFTWKLEFEKEKKNAE